MSLSHLPILLYYAGEWEKDVVILLSKQYNKDNLERKNESGTRFFVAMKQEG